MQGNKGQFLYYQPQPYNRLSLHNQPSQPLTNQRQHSINVASQKYPNHQQNQMKSPDLHGNRQLGFRPQPPFIRQNNAINTTPNYIYKQEGKKLQNWITNDIKVPEQTFNGYQANNQSQKRQQRNIRKCSEVIAPNTIFFPPEKPAYLNHGKQSPTFLRKPPIQDSEGKLNIIMKQQTKKQKPQAFQSAIFSQDKFQPINLQMRSQNGSLHEKNSNQGQQNFKKMERKFSQFQDPQRNLYNSKQPKENPNKFNGKNYLFDKTDMKQSFIVDNNNQYSKTANSFFQKSNNVSPLNKKNLTYASSILSNDSSWQNQNKGVIKKIQCNNFNYGLNLAKQQSNPKNISEKLGNDFNVVTNINNLENKEFKKRGTQFAAASEIEKNGNNNNINEQQIVKNKQVKKITFQDFQVMEKLGKGAFGDVFLVRQKTTKFLCVIKILSKQRIKQQKLQEHVLRQIKIQSYLQHKHLVSLYGFFDDQNKIYLIMEYLQDGSLSHRKKVKQPEAAYFIKQVCQGLSHMHCQKIIHRDIKPQNILMFENYLKIADYGCAVFSDSFRKTVVGCLAYISPQQLNHNAYDQKIDAWSLGVLTYQLLMGKSPFQEDLMKMAKIEYQNRLTNDSDQTNLSGSQFPKLKFPQGSQISPQAQDFIHSLLQQNPEDRMQLRQALKHKFIKKSWEWQRALQEKVLKV